MISKYETENDGRIVIEYENGLITDIIIDDPIGVKPHEVTEALEIKPNRFADLGVVEIIELGEKEICDENDARKFYNALIKNEDFNATYYIEDILENWNCINNFVDEIIDDLKKAEEYYAIISVANSEFVGYNDVKKAVDTIIDSGRIEHMIRMAETVNNLEREEAKKLYKAIGEFGENL